MNPNRSLADRLKKTRLDLVMDAPFFGSLAFKLEMKPDPTTESAMTDGKVIRINPEFAAKLTDSQLSGLAIECILHCAQGHLWRRGQREIGGWNKACDQVAWEIISGLQQATDGRVMMPPNGRVDPSYQGLSAEEVYHQMKNDGKDKGDNGGNYQSPGAFENPAPDPQGQPGDGEGKGDGQGESGGGDSGGDPPPPQSSLEDEWKSAVTQAATAERMANRGNMPAWMKSLVDDLIEPKVPWTEHVREFCHRLSRDDYSFRRPNRRLLSRGFVLPSLQSEKLGPIVGAFDTSGSIFCHPELVQAILSEFQGVLDLCRPEMMRLIDCDTRIHQEKEFMPGESLLSFVPQGGGGTDFRPVFVAIAEMPEPPACLIFLTDLEGWFPETEPDYPVLWANFGNPTTKAPFGITIHVPLEA